MSRSVRSCWRSEIGAGKGVFLFGNWNGGGDK